MPFDIELILKQLGAIFLTAIPWLTGGLAGAILTYNLNQRSTRKKQPRLRITTERIDYSIPARDESLRALMVSYDGTEYESLELYQFYVENLSDKTASTTPFLFLLSESTQIINISTLVTPLNREIGWNRQADQPGTYIWNPGELKPSDTARLRLLVSPVANIERKWRGEDDVEVASFGADSTQEYERELGTIVGWVAIYVMLGATPIIGQLAQALQIVASTPKIVQLIIRWSRTFRPRKKSGSPTIVVSGAKSDISVTTNSTLGTSEIAIRNIDGDDKTSEVVVNN